MTTTFPKLYHLGKGGKKLYSVEIWAENNTVYSLAGTDEGKKILSNRVCTPKNVGRANATTAEEQAVIEATAAYNHKLSRKYSLTKEEAVEEDIQPMLAESFEKKKKKVVYPISIQRKYNGVRALCSVDENGKVTLSSRGAREWTTLSHIQDELSKVLKPGDILDGEIYLHQSDSDITFQNLMSLVKRKQPGTENLEYHCYDFVAVQGDDSQIWLDRQKNLENFFKENSNLKYIKLAETYTANSEEEVYLIHNKFVEEGYEGAMARLNNSIYIFGHRSSELLKIKSFQDAEFKVKSVENGVGKFSLCAIFVLTTSEGKEFKAVPKATQLEKEEMLRNANDYIGKLATVKFFSLSDDNVPLFPVLLGFRPEQDLSI